MLSTVTIGSDPLVEDDREGGSTYPVSECVGRRPTDEEDGIEKLRTPPPMPAIDCRPQLDDADPVR